MELMKMRSRSFLLGWMVAVLLGMAASGCAFVNLDLFREARPLQETVIEGKGPGKVLIMDISGLLTYEGGDEPDRFSQDINLVARVKEELDKAAQDKEVKALILRIYSPGGTVSASDLLRYEIQQFKKNNKVKVVACFMGVAASGGYYVATAADYIIAQPTTLTGSIGVIALKFNIQGLMEKVGVEDETVKSGDKKDIWSLFRPATAEEKEILQGIVDEYQGEFLKVVRTGRKDLTQEDLAVIGDGRIFSGQQALELHLVDELGYLEDAVEWARKSVGMPRAKVVAYHRPGTFVNNIYSMSQGEPRNWLDRFQGGGQLLRTPTPQFMYLWLP